MSIAFEVVEDRRRNPRKRVKQRAVVKTSAGEKLDCTVIEISTNGVGIMLHKPLPIGMTCQVAFNIFLGGRSVSVAGAAKIMNCSCSGLDGFRMGMSYQINDPEVEKLINDFIG